MIQRCNAFPVLRIFVILLGCTTNEYLIRDFIGTIDAFVLQPTKNPLSMPPISSASMNYLNNRSENGLHMSQSDGNNDNDSDNSSSGTDEATSSSSFLSKMLYIESTRLLLGDVVTVLLTCQLLGLADAISVEGLEGFLLPISMPTTLGTLVQRDAAISLAWILAALKNGSYLVASISDDEAIVKSVLETFVDYCILRVGGALALAFLVTHQSVDGVELLRQCWFTLVMLGTFRWLYAKNTVIY